MAIVELPAPQVRRVSTASVDAAGLAEALRRVVSGEVRFDDGSRALYATDSSNYRQVPIGVVVPRTLDDVVAAVAACRQFGAPVLSRGGGTSLAGECCNVAVVMDFSKYLTKVESVDPDRRLAVVQPGLVLDELNRQTRPHGWLVFGPKPATHNHCTIGGMIGNNSCGSTAQWSGTTGANIERLEILTYDGERMWVGKTSDEEYQRILDAGGRRAEIYRALRELRDRYRDEIVRRFPRIPRRISGFNLLELLEDHGFNIAGALAGTESTCVTVLRAEVRLLPEPKAKVLSLYGFPDIASAADAVPELNKFSPYVLEGMDNKLLNYERMEHMHPGALELFRGRGAWLLAQFGGDTKDEAREAAVRAAKGLGAHDRNVITDAKVEQQIWAVRESGLGATARTPGGGPDTWPGWEDSAVTVDKLGDYLRDFQKLLDEFGYNAASLYGHFGQACLHTSIPFDLMTAEGVRDFRRFVERAADLCVHYNGSLSGEHGDGQARGELLYKMYGHDLVRAFEEFKAIFDPDNKMNPGKVVHANPLDSELRLGSHYAPAQPDTYFHYQADDGSFARAALRCAGVGECRRHHPEEQVMCPSYQVTKEEKHSTRGRARLLFEMLRGETITDGWRSEAVADALDLCLACKGCKRDCPVEVDMATYKAEFLSHHYQGRIRPRDHYSLGWLPVLARVGQYTPELINAVTQTPGIRQVAKRIAGIDPRRTAPRFPNASFTRWFHRRQPRGSGERGKVLLWPDSFTAHLDPGISAAAIGVLEAAGFEPVMPHRPVCCGLTWITTGQLGIARRVLRNTLEVLAPYLRDGVPILGLEPSCTAVFRSDARELLGHDPDIDRLQKQTRTLAELLAEKAPDFAPELPLNDLGDQVEAIVQVHCHHHAIMGTASEWELLSRIGVKATKLDSGCCGLAGNFGVTEAHRDVSLACAEQAMLPAIRQADPRTVVVADGFSCRTQIQESDVDRRPVHLAELLNAAVRGILLGAYPEHQLAVGRRLVPVR
jgi:FAD/FMN-containing dehydrogenase/Fe-S oxidoreductase